MSKLEHPKRCTICKSPYWDRARTRGVIEAISRQHPGQPAHIVPIDSIDHNNAIIRQRKGFEKKHRQLQKDLAEA